MVSRDDKVDQLYTVVLGVEGLGGLVREVDSLKERVADVEKRVNVISGKWLALMTLLAIAGQFAARLLIK